MFRLFVHHLLPLLLHYQILFPWWRIFELSILSTVACFGFTEWVLDGCVMRKLDAHQRAIPASFRRASSEMVNVVTILPSAVIHYYAEVRSEYVVFSSIHEFSLNQILRLILLS